MSAPLRIAILVLSDQGAVGERADTSGPALRDWLAERGHPGAVVEILPDVLERIAVRLAEWSDAGTWDLVLTCGGTGVSLRDVTPEATRQVIDREIPGLGEQMRRASAAVSPHALISRALGGTRGSTLIVNLPGSPRAAIENLEAIWPALPHLIAKLQGDMEDCGAP
jgi:molybdenum cofactor synthesis domain-containing protein